MARRAPDPRRDGDNVDKAWLDYAWHVIACPDTHRSPCSARGGAVPGRGRVDGNELRWPGYLGPRWEPGRGALCVGGVHCEAYPVKHADPVLVRTDAELVAAARAWLAESRSPYSDDPYLRPTRDADIDALP
jgi:hypothetical protein